MKRPYVVINCAMSLDGKIARPSGEQLRISSYEDIKRMYEMRNKSDAVLVGVGTVLSDDPKLTVKEKLVKNPKNPIRIILDSSCKTPVVALAVDEKAPTWIASSSDCDKIYNKNVEVIVCEKDKDGLIDLKKLLEFLHKRGIKKLMVEGGSTVISNFLKQGLVDDFFVYVGPMIIGGKETPSLIKGELDNNLKFKIIDSTKIGPGVLLHYRLVK
jgi:2,5-diamino-6-(ribosylamino)-4(3H)-pyrimidinone 5'-phosphate reductase